MSRDLQHLSSSKPRLVLVLATFPKLSETFLVTKFLGLLESGWDVHIVCHQVNQQVWKQFPELIKNPALQKRVHQTWPSQQHWLAALLILPVALTTLFKASRHTWHYWVSGWQRFGWGVCKHFYLDAALIALKPDILHFEFGSLAVGKMYLKEILETKLSVSFRGYDLNYIGLDQDDYYQAVWESLDSAHFLGQDLWERAQRRGAPEDLTHVLIPPAIDLPLFPQKNSRRDGILGSMNHPLRILSVGRLHWKKGYEFTIQAVKKLQDKGIHCVYEIIGDGDYKAALYFARHQLGLDAVVEFCGGLTHEQVIKHLEKADVFLHGAVSEGFCNAVLEAQAMELPVVCTNADGLSENVLDGVTGFVVPRRDPAAMAEKLALLAEDGALRQQMGAAGRERVSSHFRLADQIAAFEKFYAAL
jgi:colanic acid/amylovoran biosynthesis glycosyltransferase